MELTKHIYTLLTYSIYILYVAIYLGVWNTAPEYLQDVNYYLKVFIGTMLAITFNPFYTFKSSSIHRNISFSAGILLLTSTTLTSFTDRLQTTVKRVQQDILQNNIIN